MAKYFYMLMRKKKVQKKIFIKNTKPKFIRVHSGEFNFPFKDVSLVEIIFVYSIKFLYYHVKTH